MFENTEKIPFMLCYITDSICFGYITFFNSKE